MNTPRKIPKHQMCDVRSEYDYSIDTAYYIHDDNCETYNSWDTTQKLTKHGQHFSESDYAIFKQIRKEI